ncbi:MAG: dihydrolipoyl dehydrogenase [Clostridium sp.]|nr:dihydrolipoyl dehydrogenase [Clostridium sp.]
MTERFDLVIIGAGPGGYEAAIEAARKGMKTALVENRELGGTCLNRGCIPTKTILHTAELYRELESGPSIGLNVGERGFDMAGIQARKEAVLEQLRGGIEALMKMNKVKVYRGTGVILDSSHVKVWTGEPLLPAGPGEAEQKESAVLETKHILIATGSVPWTPPVPGADLPGVLSSDGLLDKKDLFEHLVVIGGGVIGMEFASIYSSLGRKVTVIEALDRILANMDKEISQNLKMILKKRGVDFHTAAVVEEIVQAPGGGLICRYKEKDKACEVKGDGILIATGRRAYTQGLITEESAPEIRGMEMERGCIVTDGSFHTSVPGIYAVGDVIGGIQLAHMATAEGRCAAAHMAGEKPSIDISVVPGCVYTNPEIGTVGISGDEAKARGMGVITKKYVMTANGKSILSLQERGFIKVTADAESHKILGAQMMCARATDMISQFGAAIVNGLTLEDMGKVIFPHPTFSEGISEAVRL